MVSAEVIDNLESFDIHSKVISAVEILNNFPKEDRENKLYRLVQDQLETDLSTVETVGPVDLIANIDDLGYLATLLESIATNADAEPAKIAKHYMGLFVDKFAGIEDIETRAQALEDVIAVGEDPAAIKAVNHIAEIDNYRFKVEKLAEAIKQKDNLPAANQAKKLLSDGIERAGGMSDLPNRAYGLSQIVLLGYPGQASHARNYLGNSVNAFIAIEDESERGIALAATACYSSYDDAAFKAINAITQISNLNIRATNLGLVVRDNEWQGRSARASVLLGEYVDDFIGIKDEEKRMNALMWVTNFGPADAVEKVEQHKKTLNPSRDDIDLVTELKQYFAVDSS